MDPDHNTPEMANNASSPFELRTSGRGDGERSKITAGGVATPHLHKHPFDHNKPGVANNASLPFESRNPGKGNRKRSKITVGEVATPNPHLYPPESYHAGDGEQRFIPKNENNKENNKKNPTNRNEEYKWTRTKYNTTKGNYVTNINK